jgi:lysophospholipase L1-like esterase
MLARKIGKNILAILLGVSVSFFLLEGLLRIFQPIEFRVKSNKITLPRDKKYQIFNDKTGKLDKTIATSRNHLGFRGEMPPKNFAGYVTIVAVGGSTTACEYISDGKTWCDLLAEKLKRKNPHIWLNNAGLDGLSTYGHLILMEDFIIQLRPKVVLFLVGANEQGLSDYAKWDLRDLKKPVTGFLASSLEKLINASEVLDYAINFSRYYKAKKIGVANPIFDFYQLKPVDIPGERVNSILQSHREKYLQLLAERLTRLIEISRENSLEPVFITQPMVFGDAVDPVTGIDLGRAGIQGMNGKTLWQQLELYNEVVRNTASKHGVHLIDLAREMPKTSEFFYDTYHFTNAGCAAVAEIVAKRLEPFLEKNFSN